MYFVGSVAGRLIILTRDPKMLKGKVGPNGIWTQLLVRNFVRCRNLGDKVFW